MLGAAIVRKLVERDLFSVIVLTFSPKVAEE